MAHFKYITGLTLGCACWLAGFAFSQSSLNGWSPSPALASNPPVESAASAITVLAPGKALVGWSGYNGGQHDFFSREVTALTGVFSGINIPAATPNDEIYPALAASGSQTYAAWIERSLFSGHGRVMFARGAAGTWQTPLAITGFINRTTEVNLVTSGSRLVLIWCDARSGAPNLYRAGSNDAGTTWSTPVAITNGAQNWYPSVAFDGARIYLAWESWASGHGEIAFKESADLGQSWTTSVILSTDDDLASERPSVCVSNGQPRIVWQEEQGTGRYALQWYARLAGNQWNGQRLTALIGDARRPKAIASGNTIWVAYQSPEAVQGADAPRLLTSLNDGQTWLAPALIAENSTAGGGQATLAAGTFGNLKQGYLAWNDYAFNPAVLRVRTNPPAFTAVSPQRWISLP